MKRFCFICAVLLAACDSGPIRAGYDPVLPSLPGAWQKMLGAPHWRLEWINSEGKWSSWEGQDGFPVLALMQEWTSPVLAWPYWPEKGLYPRQMSPAGALFPWDISGNRIILSWKAGLDALFWQELASNQNAGKSSGTPRYPWYFDWPRFRELMESENITPEVRLDPWLADWKEIAKKTAESGFDRRRIKAETRTALTVSPSPASLWIGYSCFADPLVVLENEPLVLKVRESPETWISESGLLRCKNGVWIFIPALE